MAELLSPSSSNAEKRAAFRTTLAETITRYLAYFPDEKKRLEPLTAALKDSQLDMRLRSTIPEGHMCASAVILSPKENETLDGAEILMLEHKALGIWVVPGGHYDLEDDGQLKETAWREASEETGLPKSGLHLHKWHERYGIPLDIDTHPIPANSKKSEGAHRHFDFRYVFEVGNYAQALQDTTVSFDPSEITSMRSVPISAIDQSSSIAPALAKISSGHLNR